MKRILLAAAFLSTSAFANTTTQKADLNFAFSTPAGKHDAGSYKLQIRDNPGTGGIIELRNAETGKAVMFYPVSMITTYKQSEAPRMVFKCADSQCSLAEIWTGTQGYAIRQRKRTPAEAEKVAVTVSVSTAAAE
jgi:hypothetical protein